MVDDRMPSQLSHRPPVSYLPLSKNEMDDRARGKAVAATADGDKATLAVGESG